MNRSRSARHHLDVLLPDWQTLLQGWAASGELVAAARAALQLPQSPAALTALMEQWAAGSFQALPPIELLPATSMRGSVGAYAIDTGTIYLKANWLQGARGTEVLAVLSEELGHHLDGLLNSSDTAGDEGELFAALLHGDGVISARQRQRLLAEADHGSVLVNGTALAVEPSTPNALPSSITLAVSPASVTEDGTANLVYRFRRTGDISSALTVNYTVSGTARLVGSPTDRADYRFLGSTSTATSRTATFAAGSATAVVTVDPSADSTLEANETVALNLVSGFGYTIGTTTAVTGTIFNDDILPSITLAVSPAAVAEDDSTNLVYGFRRTGDITSALTVNYTVGGTARLVAIPTDRADYRFLGSTSTATLRTVTFAAGSATAVVTVDPSADSTSEYDETVALTLAAGTGYTIGTTTAVTGTITNDDATSITLDFSPTSVTEDGASSLVYTFTRTGDISRSLTVNYTVGGTARLVGTPTDSADYVFLGSSSTAASRTVTFAAGSATATVTVDPRTDSTIEANETVTLTLAAGAGYTIGTTTAVTGTITNDDLPVGTSFTPLANAIADAIFKAASALKDDMLPFRNNSTGSGSQFKLKAALERAATEIKTIANDAALDFVIDKANQALRSAFPSSNPVNYVSRTSNSNEIRLNIVHEQYESIDKLDFKLDNFKLLSFEASGTPELGINTTLDITAGLGSDGQPYISTDATDQPELKVGVTARLSRPRARGGVTPTTAEAHLGFVALSATDKPTGFGLNRAYATQAAAQFSIDIKDRDGGNDQRITNLGKLADATTYEAKLTGDANVVLELQSKFDALLPQAFGGFKPKLPSLQADLRATWGFSVDNLFSTGASIVNKGLNASLESIKLDAGSLKPLFTDVIGPAQKAARQIKPFIDALTKPIPGFNTVGLPNTLIDLLREIGEITESQRDNIKAVAKALEFLVNLPDFGTGMIDLGRLSLIEQAETDNASAYNPATSAPASSSGLSRTGLNSAKINALETAPTLSGTSTNAQDPVRFPLLEDPLNVVNLLLGKDVDIISVNLPISLPEIELEQSIPIPVFGVPLQIKIGGRFAADINLGFGYDTSGLNKFLQALATPASPVVRPELLLDGLYLSDHKQGTTDHPELIVSAGITIGAGVGVFGGSVGVDGNIDANVEVDLRDPNDDGKLRFNEFTGVLSGPPDQLASRLLSLFELDGTITAFVGVYAEFFGKSFRIDSPEVTLLDLDLLNKPPLPVAPVSNDQPVTSLPRLNIKQAFLIDDTFLNLYSRTALGSNSQAIANLAASLAGSTDIEPAKKLATTKTLLSDRLDEILLTSFVGDKKLDLRKYPAAASANIRLTDNSNILYATTAKPVVIASGKGADWLQAGQGNADFDGGDGADFLIGGSGANSLKGGPGNDYFFVGTGASQINGGDGHDVVSYKKSSQLVGIDLSLGGSNSGAAARDTYISIEQFEGTSLNDSFKGSAGNDAFWGLDGSDVISGEAGNDILVGGRGADILNGGAGIDSASYTDSEVGVAVSLQSKRGIDQQAITGSQPFANGDTYIGIENILGSGFDDFLAGDAADNMLVGFNGNDQLLGDAGNDMLDGGAGADRLTGGDGNDTYIVDNAADVVVEGANAGIDTVQASVTHTLAANVERLTLIGSAAINGTGNALANTIIGNSAANTLNGGDGADLLIGGEGNDTLTGGFSVDIFRFESALSSTTNRDTITDFNTGLLNRAEGDRIELENGVFTALTSTGTLAATAFRSGSSFTSAAQRILYNPATGNLTYDSNGSASGGITALIATLTNKPVLGSSMLIVT